MNSSMTRDLFHVQSLLQRDHLFNKFVNSSTMKCRILLKGNSEEGYAIEWYSSKLTLYTLQGSTKPDYDVLETGVFK